MEGSARGRGDERLTYVLRVESSPPGHEDCPGADGRRGFACQLDVDAPSPPDALASWTLTEQPICFTQ